MNGITRKPAFWVAFAVASAICAALAWEYFPQALPLINLEVKMSRDAALEEAGAIATRLHLAAAGARRAAVFAHDGATQNYVELEGGGKSAFARLLSGEAYSPYYWDVRLFTPGEIAEARVRFKHAVRFRAHDPGGCARRRARLRGGARHRGVAGA
jgi:hypothetical protein